MNNHNKATMVREYCLARKIPYRIKSPLNQLVVGKEQKDVIFSLDNLPWCEIIPVIDSMVEYNEFGYFAGMKN